MAYLHENSHDEAKSSKCEVVGSKGNSHSYTNMHVERKQHEWLASPSIRETSKEKTTQHDSTEVYGGGQITQVSIITWQVPLKTNTGKWLSHYGNHMYSIWGLKGIQKKKRVTVLSLFRYCKIYCMNNAIPLDQVVNCVEGNTVSFRERFLPQQANGLICHKCLKKTELIAHQWLRM